MSIIFLVVNCCVCDEEIRAGDPFRLSASGGVAVHDPRCTHLVPHRYLEPQETAEMRRRASPYRNRATRGTGMETPAEKAYGGESR